MAFALNLPGMLTPEKSTINKNNRARDIRALKYQKIQLKNY
jgi:hypothetical protein